MLSQACTTSSRKPVFIDLNYWCGLYLKLKELLYSQKYSHWVRVLHCCWLSLPPRDVGTAIEQYRSRIGGHNNFVKAKDAFETCARKILEYDAYDVLLKCVLLTNIKRRFWTLQVVEWGDVLVYTNDVLQCLPWSHICPELQSNEIHALYDKHQEESYSLFSISFLITFSAISCWLVL